MESEGLPEQFDAQDFRSGHLNTMRVFGWFVAVFGTLVVVLFLSAVALVGAKRPMVESATVVAVVPVVSEAMEAAMAASGASLVVQTAALEDDEDEYQGMPPGVGRDEVLGYCGSCHSMKLVTQQGLSRSTWVDVLEYMVDEQGMSEIDPQDELLVLDYLEEFYGPDRLALTLANQDASGASVSQPAAD